MKHGLWYLSYSHTETDRHGNILVSSTDRVLLNSVDEFYAIREAAEKWVGMRPTKRVIEGEVTVENHNPRVIYEVYIEDVIRKRLKV